jgi:class 3 adenylate cyclase
VECNQVESSKFQKLPLLISEISSKLYAEKHSNVSILFADVVGYTQMTTQLPVRTLVETLHELFVKFDEASAVS